MTKRIGSSKRKTKHMMSKPYFTKGKFPIMAITQNFSIGQKVVLKAEPSIHKGLYFRRFHGKTGLITGKTGKSYNVAIKDGSKNKIVIVSPAHMVKA